MSTPRTLCIDVGGSAFKAAVFGAGGEPLAGRISLPTPYPLSPDAFLDVVATIAERLGDHERVALGFPGMVRDGRVLTAPFFVTTGGPWTSTEPGLLAGWTGLDLAAALAARLGRPARVANDADMFGLGVVSGRGLELVITLGTGFGTALCRDGALCPHLELAHHPLRDGESYNGRLGSAALRRVGAAEWNRRVRFALDTLRALLHPDRIWIGGGNARLLEPELEPDVTLVSADAGLAGGVRVWNTAG